MRRITIVKKPTWKCQVMTKFLQFFNYLTLFFLFNAATANADCANYNTKEFFSEIDYDQFIHCSSVRSGALNFAKDSAGNIPIFNAIAANVDPFDISTFFNELDDEQITKLFSVKNNKQQSLLHFALEAQVDIELLLAALSWGMSADQLAVGSKRYVADAYAFKNDPRDVLTSALLKLAGAQLSVSPSLTYSDQLALYKPELWSEISFGKFVEDLSSQVNTSFTDDECRSFITFENMKDFGLDEFIGCPEIPFEEYFDADGSNFLHLISRHASDPKLFDVFLGNLDEELRNNLLTTGDRNGLVPLHVAALYNSNPSIITRLIAWGTSPDVPVERKVKWNEVLTRDWKKRPVHFAAERGDAFSYDIMLTLLAHGAKPSVQDPNGNTALHLLLSKEVTDTAKISMLLYAHNINAGIISAAFSDHTKMPKNAKGATPLLYAVTKKLGDSSDRYSEESVRHYFMVREFLEFGSNPDSADENGWTPLLLYALRGNDADTFLELLFYSGKACDTVNDDGITVLAALKKNQSMSSQNVFDGTFETSVLGFFQKECFGK